MADTPTSERSPHPGSPQPASLTTLLSPATIRAWLGSARLGSARLGSARLGSARLGLQNKSGSRSRENQLSGLEQTQVLQGPRHRWRQRFGRTAAIAFPRESADGVISHLESRTTEVKEVIRLIKTEVRADFAKVTSEAYENAQGLRRFTWGSSMSIEVFVDGTSQIPMTAY